MGGLGLWCPGSRCLKGHFSDAGLHKTSGLVEGCARYSSTELARFIQIAIGSVNEVHYLLLIGKDLAYLDPAVYDQAKAETISLRKGLIALQKRVWERTGQGPAKLASEPTSLTTHHSPRPALPASLDSQGRILA